MYSNIYLREHPERATELVQYNHIICTAASAYTWENVYTYDHEFRIHMGNFPQKSWGLILQQAWTMFLKDRLRSNGPGGSQFRQKKEICKRYNKGLCTAGMGCKYDHKCLECGTFGHEAYICHRKSGGRNGGPQQQPAPSTSAMSVNNTNQANNVRSGQSATGNNN